MSQFEEIVAKNRRMIRVVLFFPAVFIFLSLIAFMLSIPVMGRIKKVEDAKRAVIADSEITSEELPVYISELETDDFVKSVFKNDREYNVALSELYLRKRDFGKLASHLDTAISADSYYMYYFYKGLVQFESGNMDGARGDIGSFFALRLEENAYDLDTSPVPWVNIAEENANLILDSTDTLNELKGDFLKGNFNSQDALKKIAIMEDAENLVGSVRDVDYNSYLIELYYSQNDYSGIKKRAEKMVELKDNPIYHYYLSLVNYNSQQIDGSIDEMKVFLSGNAENISGFNLPRKIENGRILLSNINYSRGQYSDVLETIRPVISERAKLTLGEKGEILREFNSVVSDRKHYETENVDSDLDSLSDTFEDLMGTDKNNNDTDGDGYDDKKEFIHGHNPLIKSPEDALTDYDYANIYSRIVEYYPSVYKKYNEKI